MTVHVVEPSDQDRMQAVLRACEQRVSGHGRVTLEQLTADLADEAGRGGTPDLYGNGGVVAEVEEQVRSLFDAEAAVLLPSGTMAQQIALRLHCQERDLWRVAMHPTSHPLLWEEDALLALHRVEVVTDTDSLDGVAAVLVELPRRETGGFLLPYDDLLDLSFRCGERGVALHLDGARLWQCGPAYSPRSLGDVVALADTTYLSLYKDLGGLAGAVLLCPEEDADEVRTWRHRHGGTLPALWPLALSARRGLRERLPRMPLYVAAARALADRLETAEPVQTAMLHVVLEGDLQRLADALVDVADASGTWIGGGVRQGPRPGTGVVELACGEATLLVDPDAVVALLAQVSDRAR